MFVTKPSLRGNKNLVKTKRSVCDGSKNLLVTECQIMFLPEPFICTVELKNTLLEANSPFANLNVSLEIPDRGVRTSEDIRHEDRGGQVRT